MLPMPMLCGSQVADAKAIRPSNIGVVFAESTPESFQDTQPAFVVSPSWKINEDLSTCGSWQHGEGRHFAVRQRRLEPDNDAYYADFPNFAQPVENANAAYQSKFNSDVALSSCAWLPARTLVDLSVGLGSRSGSFDVSLLLENAFDDDTRGAQTWNSFSPAFPRWWGVVFSGRLYATISSCAAPVPYAV